MSDTLKRLRGDRARMVNEMRDIVDRADREKREPTKDEAAKHDRLYYEQDRLRTQIVTFERQEEVDRDNSASERRGRHAGRNRTVPTGTAIDAAFRSWLRTGHIQGDGAGEFRALQADSDPEGGYLVAPERFARRLIKAIDDETFIRRHAFTIDAPNADSLGVPSLEADPADADWTTELATGTEDSDMTLGKRALHPHPLAKRLKVSKKLLRAANLPADDLIIQRLAYKFGVTQEKAFLTGDGAGKPLGIYTANNDGIPTSRDVSTGNTTTGVTFDGLIEAKYAVKGGYWRNARWNFHRDAVKQIAKLKDGEGQYIWRESAREDEPDMILGKPVDISEFTPNTFTTGRYVGAFGDFSHYWIADALTMQIQRLEELYAETNQTGFIGRLETDGMPVLAEAFARVQLA